MTRRDSDWSGEEFRGTIERFYRCRATLRPSADVIDGPRASTKGRVEAQSRLEKNDRTDLAEEIATRKQVKTKALARDNRTRSGKERFYFKQFADANHVDRLYMHSKNNRPQATPFAEPSLDTQGYFRKGDTTKKLSDRVQTRTILQSGSRRTTAWFRRRTRATSLRLSESLVYYAPYPRISPAAVEKSRKEKLSASFQLPRDKGCHAGYRFDNPLGTFFAQRTSTHRKRLAPEAKP